MAIEPSCSRKRSFTAGDQEDMDTVMSSSKKPTATPMDKGRITPIAKGKELKLVFSLPDDDDEDDITIQKLPKIMKKTPKDGTAFSRKTSASPMVSPSSTKKVTIGTLLATGMNANTPLSDSGYTTASPMSLRSSDSGYSSASSTGSTASRRRRRRAFQSTSEDEEETYNHCHTLRPRDFDAGESLGEGGFGQVFKAVHIPTNTFVAIKKLKDESEATNDNERATLTKTTNRELSLVAKLKHPNLVEFWGTFLNKSGRTCIVMELADNDMGNILEFHKHAYSDISHIKCLMKQFLQGLCYLHTNNVIHRDLKPENILINKNGVLKICDFGISRNVQDHAIADDYTPDCARASYRAPELLAMAPYSSKIDMWAAGTIMAQFILNRPLYILDDTATFQNEEKLRPLYDIIKGEPLLSMADYNAWLRDPLYSRIASAWIGKQSSAYLKKLFARNKKVNLSDVGVDFITSLLCRDPQERLDAQQALEHPWFNENPLPAPPRALPVYERVKKVDNDN